MTDCARVGEEGSPRSGDPASPVPRLGSGLVPVGNERWSRVATKPDPKTVSMDEAAALGEEAFVFGLPLVYIGVQVDTNTNVARPVGGRAPLNQFAHFRTLPDASDQIVVGLNVDTLYSLGSFDVSQGPLVLSVPEMGDRYWLMQLIDAWNGIPHVPGTRTLGGKGGDFGIVGPGWTGDLPAGVPELRMPTNLGI